MSPWSRHGGIFRTVMNALERMPGFEVLASGMSMAEGCLVMRPCLGHGDAFRTVMDALEVRWTGAA